MDALDTGFLFFLLAAKLVALSVALLSSALTGNFRSERRYLYALSGYTAAIMAWFGVLWVLKADPPWYYYWSYYGVASIPVAVTSVRLVREEIQVLPGKVRRLIVSVACMAAAIAGASVMPFDPDVLVVFLGSVTFASGLIMHGVANVREATDTLHGGATARVLSLFWMFLGGSLFFYSAGVQVNKVMWEIIGQWLPGVVVVLGALALAWSFHTTVGLPVYVRARRTVK
jgi:hypothetical protein